MAWTDARIGYGRIGYLPIGGRFAAPDLATALDQKAFVVEVRTPTGELVAYLQNAFAVGYEELVDGIGSAWASLDIDDSKWTHVQNGRLLVVRERSQRPKVFIIRGIKEDRK